MKRCLARSLIDPALEPEPVGVGVGVGVGEVAGVGVAVGVGVGVGVGLGDGVGVGVGVCADAGMFCAGISASEIAAESAVEKIKLRVNSAIVSARTACRWDRCRRRRAA